MTRPAIGRLLIALACASCATTEPAITVSTTPPATRRTRHKLVAGPLPSSQPRRTVQLDAEDVAGQPVMLGAPAQPRVAVVFFLSRQSREESGDFIGSVDEKTLDTPIDQIAIVDLHKYSGIAIKPIAMRQMRKSMPASLASRRQRREARGVDASEEAVRRWHLIGDFDGSLFARFQVAADPMHPVAFVVDRSGELHGPYTDVTQVVSAVSKLTRPSMKTAERPTTPGPG
jgi:hypothetical protein